MSFTAEMRNFCKDVAPDKIDKAVRITLTEISARLVMRSPVGDGSYWKNPPPAGYVGGRFRANWQYGFRAKPSGFIDAIDGAGSSTLASLVSSALSAPSSGIHYLTNNLPYAERIENGWSRQAPNGLVGRVELEFPAIVRSARSQA